MAYCRAGVCRCAGIECGGVFDIGGAGDCLDQRGGAGRVFDDGAVLVDADESVVGDGCSGGDCDYQFDWKSWGIRWPLCDWTGADVNWAVQRRVVAGECGARGERDGGIESEATGARVEGADMMACGCASSFGTDWLKWQVLPSRLEALSAERTVC